MKEDKTKDLKQNSVEGKPYTELQVFDVPKEFKRPIPLCSIVLTNGEITEVINHILKK
jgi:hypothetical protein